MKTDNPSDEPATMLEVTLESVFDDYTEYMLALLSQKLEPGVVLEKLTEFAEARRPEIVASLKADFDPDFNAIFHTNH
jgi:hypothetical protein